MRKKDYPMISAFAMLASGLITVACSMRLNAVGFSDAELLFVAGSIIAIMGFLWGVAVLVFVVYDPPY